LSACVSVAEERRPAAPPISKLEARALPEDEVRSIVLAQLGDVLHEYPRPSSGKRPKHPLYDLTYWTTPVAGGTRNICRFSKATFEFAGAGSPKGNAETPVRVSALDAYTLYLVIGPVDAGPEGELDEDRAKYDRECAKRNAADENAVSAESEDMLVDVIGWLDRINAMTDEQFSRLSLTCSFGPELEKQGCANVVKGLRTSAIWDVRSCPTLPGAKANLKCVETDVGDVRLTFRGGLFDDMPTSIEAGELIILGPHSRID
jgi:hypothetical protein